MVYFTIMSKLSGPISKIRKLFFETHIHLPNNIKYMCFYSLFAYFFIFGTKIAYANPLITIGLKAAGWFGLDEIVSALKTLALIALLISLIGAFAWLTGNLFDIAIDATILNFTKYLGNASDAESIMSAIHIIWEVSRDLANIIIIGVFVYIAISKILGINKRKEFEKMIVSLLSVALLINFSFFFAQTVIDISNWTAVQIYNATVPTSNDGSIILSETIASHMPGVGLGPLEIYKQSIDTDMSIKDVLKILPTMAISILLTLLMGILFLRMAFMLIYRWVILVILMTTSALAFVAMIIPKLEKYWEYWYKGLIYNAVSAPLLLLLLWAVALLNLAVSKTFQIFNKEANLEMLNENPSLLQAFVTWVLGALFMLGLVWGAIRVATTLSRYTTESVGKLGEYINNGLGRIEGLGYRPVFGAMGYVGRNTLGRGFSHMGDTFTELSATTKSKVGQKLYGYLGDKFNNLGKKGYDIRSSGFIQSQLQKAGIKYTGNAIRDGFAQLEKKAQEAQERRDKEYTQKQNDAIRESGAVEEQKENERRERELKQQKEQMENEKREMERKIEQQKSQLSETREQIEKEQTTQKELKEQAKRIGDDLRKKTMEKTSFEESKRKIKSSLDEQKSNILKALGIENETSINYETDEIDKMIERKINEFQEKLNQYESATDDDASDAKEDHIKDLHTKINELQQYKDNLQTFRNINEFGNINEQIQKSQQREADLERRAHKLYYKINESVRAVEEQKQAINSISQNLKHIYGEQQAFNDMLKERVKKYPEMRDLRDPNINQETLNALIKQRQKLLDLKNIQTNGLTDKQQKTLDHINKRLAEHAKYQSRLEKAIEKHRQYIMASADELRRKTEEEKILEKIKQLGLQPENTASKTARIRTDVAQADAQTESAVKKINEERKEEEENK